jgi:hypothetical protein
MAPQGRWAHTGRGSGLSKYGITDAQFKSWNPSIDSSTFTASIFLRILYLYNAGVPGLELGIGDAVFRLNCIALVAGCDEVETVTHYNKGRDNPDPLPV